MSNTRVSGQPRGMVKVCCTGVCDSSSPSLYNEQSTVLKERSQLALVCKQPTCCWLVEPERRLAVGQVQGARCAAGRSRAGGSRAQAAARSAKPPGTQWTRRAWRSARWARDWRVV